jgi:arabinofuranosyltransferase
VRPTEPIAAQAPDEESPRVLLVSVERPLGGENPGEGVALERIAELLSAAVLLIAVLRNGWLSDDAFITIRSVDHLLSGHGWGINPGVRVQAYTSPLWALLCIPFFWLTRDPYAALMLPALGCTLGLIVFLCRALRSAPWGAPLILLALAASSSFLSFSTSGLENPLAHWLVAAFFLERMREGSRPTAAAYWLGALIVLTRFDLVLLVLPALAWCTWPRYSHAIRPALAPLGATLCWFGFSVFYYGTPFPNTAYAKLNVELPWTERWARGGEYLLDSMTRDPWVLLAVTSAFLPSPDLLRVS